MSDAMLPGGAPSETGSEPVCPRHPDRVSYVRCQRCERPVCPECQRPAAVGVQCVDCVREQARTVRRGRTVYGGRVREGRPVVTLGLIAACVVVFLLQLVPGSDVTQRFAFAPVLADAEPWRFVTSAFLHSTGFLPHIAFNMLVLYQVGPYLEERLGRVRFLALYVISAVGGSVGFLALANPTNPFSWNAGVVGASGAVFGLFGALVVVQRHLGGTSQGLLVMIGLNFFLGFVIPNVAWQGHLGGLVTGALMGLVMVAPVPRNRTLVQVAGTVGVVLLLVGISLWKLSTAVGV
ncbi:MAG: rhomboid family intramembrane serine protease [Angustibacter sp.]